jgi:hypothetical protein
MSCHLATNAPVAEEDVVGRIVADRLQQQQRRCARLLRPSASSGTPRQPCQHDTTQRGRTDTYAAPHTPHTLRRANATLARDEQQPTERQTWVRRSRRSRSPTQSRAEATRHVSDIGCRRWEREGGAAAACTQQRCTSTHLCVRRDGLLKVSGRESGVALVFGRYSECSSHVGILSR